MPLTPEDVVEKRFQATKFREGYDQDEVDDFLDQVVLEIRRLADEQNDLRRRLADCQAREASGGGLPVMTDRPAAVVPEPAPAPSPLPARSAPAPGPAVTAAGDRDGAAAMLATAQERHDRYVREAEASRDRIVAGAHDHATKLEVEVERTRRETIEPLEREKVRLDASLQSLRAFEREFRSRLRSYLETRLSELDQARAGTPVNPAGAARTP